MEFPHNKENFQLEKKRAKQCRKKLFHEFLISTRIDFLSSVFVNKFLLFTLQQASTPFAQSKQIAFVHSPWFSLSTPQTITNKQTATCGAATLADFYTFHLCYFWQHDEADAMM